MVYVSLYCLIINSLALLILGIDKSRARRNAWRISERTLFLPALMGGSAGALLGMLVFHHKTRHLRFAVGIPLLLLFQVMAAVFAVCKIM